MKVYILDASGLINGFYSKDSLNLMTSSTVNEIKDINTEILLNNCIDEGFIKIEDVDYSNDDEIKEVLLDSGDFTRLSETDKDIVALALKHKHHGDDVITVTDDYSMQNTLKLLDLKFKSVRTKGIKKTIQWKKICKGCRKEYPSDTLLEECDICGSPIIRKRMNAHSNI
ncbi:MAG: ribonuclease VapC [Methanosphaera stadtmanae]|nr:ribonuclease VapC [Methanosphaera stadtmanae]